MSKFSYLIAILAFSGASGFTSTTPITHSSNSAQAQEKMSYPDTRREDHTDEYFGTTVPDPYRWLEQNVRNSPEVQAWVDAENKLTFSVIEKLPFRDQIEKRLTQLWDYEKYGTPFQRGDRYFYLKNDGLQNHHVLYQLPSLDAPPTVLIDPNQWSDDGTVALGGLAFSHDGALLAYGIQDAGSDWRTWKVMNVETGEQLSDELKWLKFGGVSWTNDGAGFFYSRFEKPTEGQEFTELNLSQKVYYHKLGEPQSNDVMVHVDPEHPQWGFSPEVSEDGRYLIITVHVGTDDRYRVYYKSITGDADQPPNQTFDPLAGELHELIDNFDHEYSFLGNEGSQFYFKSDNDAPKKCVLIIDVENPAKENWNVIVPETDESMESASLVGDTLIVEYLKDAKTQVKLFDLHGQFIREVKFPWIGTATGFGGKRNQSQTFYSFSSFNRPPGSYHYDLATGKSTLIRTAKVDFDPDDYEVNQVFFDSKDGTRVPMFIAHKKGLKLNGQNPTLLYGYGGFNISLTPSFSISRLQWMEMGGVFVMVNLRGGGEYGKDWHQAGTKLNKQNVFDDFIGAAEYLIQNKYTSAKHLGIQGGSNGGLLVGACMTQRPDLFGACLAAVGVMDMLKFHLWSAGRYWVDDYGSSENAEEFKALLAYSPYHNLVDGTQYPPTMITTADTDDRVVPGHSFKFAARLQAAQSGPNPTLIRIETKAGHGAGKPTAKVIEEISDQWAFLAKYLGMTPTFPE